MRVPAGGWRVAYNLSERWVKNNRDPENIVYEYIYYLVTYQLTAFDRKGINPLLVNTRSYSTMTLSIYWLWLLRIKLSIE